MPQDLAQVATAPSEYASGENRGSGRLALIVCGAPVPGKQFVETALWDVCDLRENIGEPGLGINVVQPAGLNQRVGDGRALPAAIGAAKQPRLSSERDASEATFGGVVG